MHNGGIFFYNDWYASNATKQVGCLFGNSLHRATPKSEGRFNIVNLLGHINWWWIFWLMIIHVCNWHFKTDISLKKILFNKRRWEILLVLSMKHNHFLSIWSLLFLTVHRTHTFCEAYLSKIILEDRRWARKLVEMFLLSSTCYWGISTNSIAFSIC